MIIVDNANVFAKTEAGSDILETMQRVAKTCADSSKATFIFVTSEGAALPLIMNHSDASRMHSLQLDEVSDESASKVLKKRIEKNRQLSDVSDELLNAVTAITGGDMHLLRQISGAADLAGIPVILKKAVDESKTALVHGNNKIKLNDSQIQKNFWKLAEEVCRESAMDTGSNRFVTNDRALSILSGLSEDNLQDSASRAPWKKELENIFATNALGRMDHDNVGLQYRKHRFAWNEILKKELKEKYSAMEENDFEVQLARVETLVQRDIETAARLREEEGLINP